MGWICQYCSTYNEDGDERCMVCDAEKYLSAPTVLTAALVRSLDLGSDAVIPEEYHVIGENAFQNRTNLTSVTLHERVLAIESEAFSGCTQLCEVNCAGELQRIGRRAFYNCGKLEEGKRPTAAEIGEEAFAIPPTRAELAKRRRKECRARMRLAMCRLGVRTKNAMRAMLHWTLANKEYSIPLAAALLFCVATVVFALCTAEEDWALAQWGIGGGGLLTVAPLSFLLCIFLDRRGIAREYYYTLTFISGALSVGGIALMLVFVDEGAIIGLMLCAAAAITAVVCAIVAFVDYSSGFGAANVIVAATGAIFSVLSLYIADLVNVPWDTWQWAFGGSIAIGVVAASWALAYVIDDECYFEPYKTLTFSCLLQTALAVTFLIAFHAEFLIISCILFGLACLMGALASAWSFYDIEEGWGWGNAVLAVLNLAGIFISLAVFHVF